MSEGLTKEAIDRICDFMVVGHKIDAIRALRAVWPFGLKEAKDFLDPYRADVIALRHKLYQMADIKEGAVFENSFIKIEVKSTDIPLPILHAFLMDVLFKLCPNSSWEERRNALIASAGEFLAGASPQEINELARLALARYGDVMNSVLGSSYR